MADETLEGQSFRNEALTGSGTILPDGTYGEPMPDPTEVRGLGPDKTAGGRLANTTRLDPIPDELIVDKERSTADSGEQDEKVAPAPAPAPAPAKTAPAKK